MKNRRRTRTIIFISLIFSLFIFFMGCSVLSLGTDLGYIRGTVTNAITGDPIGGVYVRAGDFFYYDDYDYTNSDGSYVLTLESGAYDVWFEKDGYDEVRVNGISVISPFTRSLDIQMNPHSVDPTPTPTFDPDNQQNLYATRWDQSLMDVFYVDKTSGEMNINAVSPLKTGSQPAGIIHIASSQRIYVANSGDNTISVFNTRNFSQISGSPFPLSSGDGQAYSFSHDTKMNRIMVTMKNSSPGKVEVLDISNADTIASLGGINAPELARDPQKTVVNNVDRHLYIMSVAGNAITAYDIDSESVSGHLTVKDPVSFSLDTIQSRLYVLDGIAGNISAIDITSPSNMKWLTETGGVNTGNRFVDCDISLTRRLLFTAEGGAEGYTLKIWNISGAPPYNQVQSSLDLGQDSVSSLLYDPVTDLLFVSHNGDSATGIRVYSLKNYPQSPVHQIPDSPFQGGLKYFMMDI